MNEDEEGASPPSGGDTSWIESLGLTEDEEELIRHSLHMADAVILREARAQDAAAAEEPARDAPGREAKGRLVRERPSMPVSSRTEPYVQPAVVRPVSRRPPLSERPSPETLRDAPDRPGSEHTPHPPLPGPAT